MSELATASPGAPSRLRRLRAFAPPSFWVGVVIVTLMIVLSLVVEFVSPHDPTAGGDAPALDSPSSRHWLGTDKLGRDVLTRTLTAARLDLGLAVIGVAVPLLVGMMIGSIIGTTRNRFVASTWDTVIQATNAFPTLIIVIGLVAVLGQGIRGVLFGLYLTAWARYAQVAKARARALRESDFMLATQCLGYSRWRVLTRHVIPNIVRVCLAYAISDFIVVILAIAGLSFLGAGVLPPTAEWGAMMNEGRITLATAWWPVMVPAAALAITAIGVALIAQRFAAEDR